MAAQPLILDPDLQERLERAAKREVRSPEFLLRDAVELYFEVHGETDDEAAKIEEHDELWEAYDGSPISHEQLVKDANEAAEEYQRTGLHLTMEEVSDWMERLRLDPDAKLPECHT